jgi:hypothetical protein
VTRSPLREARMKFRDKALLSKLVALLVDEWGYHDVQAVLALLANARGELDVIPASKDRLEQPPLAHRPKKLTAVEQVNKSAAMGGEREMLLAIAEKFDRKEFLPSVGDIREFLAMIGEASAGMKDRHEGFRRLLRPLTQLPADRLRRLASNPRYSGPAQLGPLSEAIKSTGEAIRREEVVPGADQKR